MIYSSIEGNTTPMICPLFSAIFFLLKPMIMGKVSIFIYKTNTKQQIKCLSNVSWRNSRPHAKKLHESVLKQQAAIWDVTGWALYFIDQSVWNVPHHTNTQHFISWCDTKKVRAFWTVVITCGKTILCFSSHDIKKIELTSHRQFHMWYLTMFILIKSAT